MRSARGSRNRRIAHVLALSILICLLNAAKPLLVDDTAYYEFARQIAAHPTDPYGFTIFWYQHPQPATEVLAPPVFCYWWALGIEFFGDNPVWWKLWLWPWCVVFVTAVLALAGRFVRRSAIPLTWMIVGAPTVLPALNLMLDIPALALSLAAIAGFLGTRGRHSWPAIVAVGLLTGLAMQTKYTALLTPPALVLAAWHTPRPRRRHALGQAFAAAAIGAAVFWSWEGYVAWKYGESHFLYHLRQSQEPWSRKLLLAWPLVGLIGGVGAPLLLLAAARRATARPLAVVGAAIVLSWVVLVLAPADASLDVSEPKPPEFSLNNLVFGWMGAAILAALANATVRSWTGRCADRRGRFLACWLLLEIAGYFVLSPWPAVRRVIGIGVVGTLLLGHRLSLTRSSTRRVRIAAVASVALGITFQAIDTSDAAAERNAVALATTLIHDHKPRADIWYVGHWGMQFYADRAGWRSVVPDQSTVLPGDWLVVPDREYGRQVIVETTLASEMVILDVASPWPLSTIPAYYGKNKAIERIDGPTVRLRMSRVTTATTLRSPPDE